MKFSNNLSLILPLAGALILAGCGGGNDTPPPVAAPVANQGLAFATVQRALRSGIHSERTVLVKDTAQLNQLWAEHTQGMASPPAAPTIDFSRKVLVGVFLGDVGCKSAEISSVRRGTSKIAVSYAYRSYPSLVACAPADGSPMVLATIARSDEEVQFANLGTALAGSRVMDGIEFTPLTRLWNSNIQAKRAVAVRDAAAFAALWAENTATEPVPIVNFHERMVLAVFRGPGDGCSNFGITKVGTSEGKIIVEHEDRAIPDLVCIAIANFPVQMVTIARNDAPVQFEEIGPP